MKTTAILFQTILLALLAPLVSGIIRKIKNNLRMRRGPGILQPYYNIAKLLKKEETVSQNASWIFSFTPYVVISSSITALLIVSTVVTSISGGMGGLFALIFLFGLGRFFLAVAGLEAGSAFGGMGSSREMFISALSEPAFFVAVFAALISQNPFSLSRLVAVAALFMVTIIETSRIPIDNQETHLELTMVHEAMVLEYSGRSLALIEFASHVKQIVMFSLLFTLIYSFMPAGFIQMYSATFYACFAGIILSITGAVALIEVTVAKMRLFRVPDFTTFAFVLSGTALVLAAAGL